MKIAQKFVFRAVASIMLTALTIMPMVPAGANPGWLDWIPGTYDFVCQEGSNRTLSVCTWPTDSQVTNKTVPYALQQDYDIEFGTPVGNVVELTVPKESYHSEPFFLKWLGAFAMWMQVRLVDDGNGTLGIANGAITDVDVSITITGDGSGGFTESVVRSGGSAPAGSAVMDMPLNNTVWIGTSDTDPTLVAPLLEMAFPMIVTTAFIEVTIDDTAGPWPAGPPAPVDMDGYYMNASGVSFDADTKAVTFVGAGAGLDIAAVVGGIGNIYTDYIFIDTEVLTPPAVGGITVPVDKVALLAPYIVLACTIILAVAATAIFKYRKKP